MSRRKLIAGNWKMNGSLTNNQALINEIQNGIGVDNNCDIAVCPPCIYINQVQALLKENSTIALGAQNVSQHENGAFTGDISAQMLKDFGVKYVLCGHSERRLHQAETDVHVAIKVKRSLVQGMTPIVCVGETLKEREEGITDLIIRKQVTAVMHLNEADMDKIVIAYEPVWAIGTGKTATPEQAQEVHSMLRAHIRATNSQAADLVRILYGGSMNAVNAADLLAQPDIDGGLIGGAALKAQDFLKIIAAAQN